MKLFLGLLVALVVVIIARSDTNVGEKVSSATTAIEHVIVLMLENRSFDHMLGLLKGKNPEIVGCLPDEDKCSNLVDPQDDTSKAVSVSDDAVYVQTSPSHSIAGTTLQIFGQQSPPDGSQPQMSGFIESYSSVTGSQEGGEQVMKCFSADHLPVLSNLTLEYAVIDGWFASVPGPTMPNRAYAASATSHGMGINDHETILRGMPQKTMFRQLLDMGLDYRVYFQSVPAVAMFKDMRRFEERHRYRALRTFYEDAASGDLPPFTWLEPNYFVTEKHPATDQHPDHDVSLGEELVKQVYEAVRNSPVWEKSALIITYDEHGGFFDHVATPLNVPNPDGLNSTDDPFDFQRLGIRVPTVIISPYVVRGAVYHAPPEGEAQYEHSSIPATIVHKLFRPTKRGTKQDYLTQRDAWAATFEHVFSGPLRSDCPQHLPQTFRGGAGPTITPDSPLTDLQLELMSVAAGLVEDKDWSVEVAAKMTNRQAVNYFSDKLNAFFGYKIVDLL